MSEEQFEREDEDDELDWSDPRVIRFQVKGLKRRLGLGARTFGRMRTALLLGILGNGVAVGTVIWNASATATENRLARLEVVSLRAQADAGAKERAELVARVETLDAKLIAEQDRRAGLEQLIRAMAGRRSR